MSTFTLAISCLTSPNLPWFMYLTFHVPKQYCSLQHWTFLLSAVTSTTGYCFCFGPIPSIFLELFLNDLQYHIGHPLTWWVPLSVSYHFSFSYSSWGSQDKNTEVVCHSLLQWTTFCQTSPPWPNRRGWPHRAWLSFIELDKAVVLWSDWLVFCVYGFSVSALWCPLATPSILLGFLLPWTLVICSRLLQRNAATAPYLGWRVSSHSRAWPWTWRSSSLPSCARAATASERWACSSWQLPLPRAWGSSSALLLHCCSLALLG